MGIGDALFTSGGPSDTDVLMDHFRQQQAGLGITMKHLYERIDALEKRVTELEGKLTAPKATWFDRIAKEYEDRMSRKADDRR